MKKIDFDDKNDLKTTAFRELYEEVNYPWPEKVIIDSYIDTPFYTEDI